MSQSCHLPLLLYFKCLCVFLFSFTLMMWFVCFLVCICVQRIAIRFSPWFDWYICQNESFSHVLFSSFFIFTAAVIFVADSVIITVVLYFLCVFFVSSNRIKRTTYQLLNTLYTCLMSLKYIFCCCCWLSRLHDDNTDETMAQKLTLSSRLVFSSFFLSVSLCAVGCSVFSLNGQKNTHIYKFHFRSCTTCMTIFVCSQSTSVLF